MNDRDDDLAAALHACIGLLVRRLRAVDMDGDVSMPERSALARIDRGGPATSAELAKVEQISPQAMGATLTKLEARGLVQRRPDPTDGRKSLLSLTRTGQRTVRASRHRRAEQLAEVLRGFPAADRRALATAVPIIERLAAAL